MKNAKWLATVGLICLIGVSIFFLNGCLYNREDIDMAYKEGYDDGILVGEGWGYEEGYDEGYAAGEDEGYDNGWYAGKEACEESEKRQQGIQHYVSISTLLYEMLILADGEFEFGYHVAEAEIDWQREPHFFYDLIRTLYKYGHAYLDDFDATIEDFGGLSIYVTDPAEFIQGYVAYGKYLRDEYYPEYREFLAEFLFEADLADSDEYWERKIKEYLSGENDEWGEPCCAAQDSWIDKLSDEFYEGQGDDWANFMGWIRAKYPDIYDKLTPNFIEREKEFWATE